MADGTNIEWTDSTWNPIVGCSIVSPGCTNCYAMKMAARLEKMLPPERRGDIVLPSHYSALTKPSKAGPVWTGRVNIAPEHILTQPLRWRKPKRIFVNSMGDLFHETIPDEWIDKVFAVMALTPQHKFQVLTKRAARMREYMTRLHDGAAAAAAKRIAAAGQNGHPIPEEWFESPFVNVWAGVSAERQQEADERIPHLLSTPAAVRFVSLEPLLGPIDLKESHGLDWVIVGGESGQGARPFDVEWARAIRDHCVAYSVPYFYKQHGSWVPGAVFTLRDSNGVPHGSFAMHQDGLGHKGKRSHVWAGDTFGGRISTRVGKKAAGRMLDGRTWDEMPKQG